jgi:hypothetical protein
LFVLVDARRAGKVDSSARKALVELSRGHKLKVSVTCRL